MCYALEPRYDSRASFYGKALVEETRNSKEQVQDLYSYGTLVARIITDFEKNERTFEYYGKYSCTTTRHQKEFFKQNMLSDKEIKELFKTGVFKYEL